MFTAITLETLAAEANRLAGELYVLGQRVDWFPAPADRDANDTRQWAADRINCALGELIAARNALADAADFEAETLGALAPELAAAAEEVLVP